MSSRAANDDRLADQALPSQVANTGVWIGPRLSQRSIELLTPGWWPIDVLHSPTLNHLGSVRYTVLVANPLEGRDSFNGYLCDFFTDGREILAANETSAPFSPHNFLAAVFVRKIQFELSLDDDDYFKLWLIPSRNSPAYRIVSTTQFKLALIEFYLFFLGDPVNRFRVYFVIEKMEAPGTPPKVPPPEPWSKVISLVEDGDVAPPPPQDPVKESEVFCEEPLVQEENGTPSVSRPSLSRDNAKTTARASVVAQEPQATYAPSSIYTDQPIEQKDPLPQARLRTPSPMDKLGSPVLRRKSSVFQATGAESVWTSVIADSDVSQEVSSEAEPTEEEVVMDRGVLRLLDTDARKGDFMEGDLQALLPVSSSPTEEEWHDCCSLLNLNPADHKDPGIRSVAIPGSEIKVSPRQYWTAYKMLTCRQDRNIRGGMLGDMPGTGKTHVCIVFCLLRALIFQNVVEVEAEWDTRQHEDRRSDAPQSNRVSRPKKHLPKNATNSSECSCANAGSVQCYAVPTSITRRIADKLVRGPSLIIAPPGIVEGWAEILMEAKLDKRYQACFWRGSSSGDKFAALNPPAELNHALALRVTPSEASYSPEHVVIVKDGNFTYTPSKLANRHPERFILLAAYNSAKFKAAFQVTMNVPFKKNAGTARQPRTVYGCPIGVQIVDEFHLARSLGGSWATELAKEHKHIRGGDFDFWSITATPMPESISDMSSLIDILHRPEWNEDGHHHFWKTPSALKELGQAYDRAIADTASSQDQLAFATLAPRFFSTDIIIRHVETSTFFGQPIVNLQTVQPQKHTFFTPEEYVQGLQSIANELKADLLKSQSMSQAVTTKGAFQKFYKLQLLSTFPAAADLMLEDRMVFTKDSIRQEILKWESRDVSTIPLFLAHQEEVTRDSPKLNWILRCIERMESDEETRSINTENSKKTGKKKDDRPTRDELRLKKMVIICPRMAEAVFLFLGVRKFKSRLNPVFFHGDLMPQQQREIITNFRSLKQGSPQIFIAPFDAAGTGLNLQVANYQILTGPLRMKDNETQCFGRTNRQGQQLTLHHFLLLADDNPLDRLLVTTQASRKIVSDPFDVGAGLVLEAVHGTEISDDEIF